MPEKSKYLVFGGAGSIGSELVRQLLKTGSVYMFDNNETAFFDLYEELRLKGFDVHGRIGDVRNRETVRDSIIDFSPDCIFMAAAYKHVTPMEMFPEEAIDTNVYGTLNVVSQAKRYGVKKLVYISTDKAISSYSVMGVTKKLGELMVRNAGYVTVRFGNVLGSRGSVIPIWQRQLEQGEPLTVTDERMERYFMSIEEACSLVIEAAEVGKPGQMLVLDMGEPVNVLKVAKDVLGKVGKAEHPIKMIGARPGETLQERLMTVEEEQRATRVGNYWVI